MNYPSPGLALSQAITGFLQFKTAEACSPRTLAGYRDHLRDWLAYRGDGDVATVTTESLRAYLAYLRTDYKPRRFSRKPQPLAPKTLRNIYITLSSFFTWLAREFSLPNPVKGIAAPKFQSAEVEPFTQAEVGALLKACHACRERQTERRRRFAMRRGTALRDQALLLLLLDTGLRASEVCALRVADVDQNSGKVTVRHGQPGGAKGGKGRVVYLGKTSRKALWRYLVTREDARDEEAPLFLARGRGLSRDALRQLLHSLGQKAQVKNCHPHRLRHTFAITLLRSGGDVFTLQRLLGHSTLEMVQHYARLAQLDVEQAHRRASPVDNWRL